MVLVCVPRAHGIFHPFAVFFFFFFWAPKLRNLRKKSGAPLSYPVSFSGRAACCIPPPELASISCVCGGGGGGDGVVVVVGEGGRGGRGGASPKTPRACASPRI